MNVSTEILLTFTWAKADDMIDIDCSVDDEKKLMKLDVWWY